MAEVVGMPLMIPGYKKTSFHAEHSLSHPDGNQLPYCEAAPWRIPHGEKLRSVNNYMREVQGSFLTPPLKPLDKTSAPTDNLTATS